MYSSINVRNGIQATPQAGARAPPLSRGGRVRTGDQTISSPKQRPIGHDIPQNFLLLSEIIRQYLCPQAHCSTEITDANKICQIIFDFVYHTGTNHILNFMY
jgi:hypothetical protein